MSKVKTRPHSARQDFPFLTGQPEEIRQAFRRAMGLDAEVPCDVRSPG